MDKIRFFKCRSKRRTKIKAIKCLFGKSIFGQNTTLLTHIKWVQQKLIHVNVFYVILCNQQQKRTTPLGNWSNPDWRRRWTRRWVWRRVRWFKVHEDFVEEDEVVHLVTTSMIKTVPEKYLNQFYINWQRTVFTWKVNIYYRSPEKGFAKCIFNPYVGKYLKKFPNSAISNPNFLFNQKHLGLNNKKLFLI